MFNDSESWNRYRQLRNKYNKMCQTKKNDLIRRTIEENIHDSRKLWKELRRMVNDQSESKQYIHFDGEKDNSKQV
jgi:hypothetical protein